MKTVSVGSGSPVVLIPPSLNDGSAEALAAWADYEFCQTIKKFNAAGIEFQQREEVDFNDLTGDLEDFRAGFKNWLEDLPALDSGSDPATRGVPAVSVGSSWTSIIQRIASLAVAGGLGGVPVMIADVVLDVGIEVFKKWLEGRVYPDSEGSLQELARILRKSLLHDPGVTNLERSVFVAETPTEGSIGGKKESIAQYLYESLYREPFSGEDGQQKRIEDLIDALAIFSQWFVTANVDGKEVTFSAGSVSGDVS